MSAKNTYLWFYCIYSLVLQLANWRRERERERKRRRRRVSFYPRSGLNLMLDTIIVTMTITVFQTPMTTPITTAARKTYEALLSNKKHTYTYTYLIQKKGKNGCPSRRRI